MTSELLWAMTESMGCKIEVDGDILVDGDKSITLVEDE